MSRFSILSCKFLRYYCQRRKFLCSVLFLNVCLRSTKFSLSVIGNEFDLVMVYLVVRDEQRIDVTVTRSNTADWFNFHAEPTVVKRRQFDRPTTWPHSWVSCQCERTRTGRKTITIPVNKIASPWRQILAPTLQSKCSQSVAGNKKESPLRKHRNASTNTRQPIDGFYSMLRITRQQKFLTSRPTFSMRNQSRYKHISHDYGIPICVTHNK